MKLGGILADGYGNSQSAGDTSEEKTIAEYLFDAWHYFRGVSRVTTGPGSDQAPISIEDLRCVACYTNVSVRFALGGDRHQVQCHAQHCLHGSYVAAAIGQRDQVVSSCKILESSVNSRDQYDVSSPWSQKSNLPACFCMVRKRVPVANQACIMPLSKSYNCMK